MGPAGQARPRLFLGMLCLALRSVWRELLRGGFASRESPSFLIGGMDWPAWLAADDHFCHLWAFDSRRDATAALASCRAFFAFLYQDTAWINQLEAHAEHLVRDLPPGTRVLATIAAPPDSRIAFIAHSAERACIGHCFSYENYEPASGEFRIRAQKGSPVATSSSDDAEDMASGEYEVDDADLPLKQIYQCDANDLRKLCIRDLEAGETNGRLSIRLPPR